MVYPTSNFSWNSQSKVLIVGSLGETAYMVQNLVQGENGIDSTYSQAMIWRQLGQHAQTIHLIPVKGFGDTLLDPEEGCFFAHKHDNFDGTWNGFLTYNIESLTESDELIRLGLLNIAQSREVRSMFRHLQECAFSFGLNYGDLSIKNTIVDSKGRVTLIDWGCASVNIAPHSDLIELLKCQLDSGTPDESCIMAFLEGYGLSQNDFQEMQGELNAMLLLRAIDTLRWAIHCNPGVVNSYCASANAVLQYVLR